MGFSGERTFVMDASIFCRDNMVINMNSISNIGYTIFMEFDRVVDTFGAATFYISLKPLKG